MREINDIVNGKNAVLRRLNAELATATRLYAAADPFSAAERWYGAEMRNLNVAIAEVKREINMVLA